MHDWWSSYWQRVDACLSRCDDLSRAQYVAQLPVIMQEAHERMSAALLLVRGEYERRRAECRQNAVREAEQYWVAKVERLCN